MNQAQKFLNYMKPLEALSSLKKQYAERVFERSTDIVKPQLGYKITDVDLNNMSVAQLYQVQNTLWTHGVVCIKNQKLSIQQQIEFTSKLGKVVILPSFYAFDNREKDFPEIVRVGNVRLDDSVKPSSKDAEYWHKDGDFRQPGENFILSLLHPKEIAKVGGKTGYVDCEQVYNDLPQKIKDMLEGATVTIQTSKIPDFSSAKPEEHYPDSTHPVFEKHPISKKNVFNLVYAGEKDITLKDGTVVDSRDFSPEFEKVYKIYGHQWEMGDVVIWDNIRVLHRSLGGFGDNRRLLFRTQSQIPY